MTTIDQLNALILDGARRFERDTAESLNGAVNHIIRYREFLDIITSRYSDLSTEHQQVLDHIKGSPPELVSLQRIGAIWTGLHLEIESFYLFAKILLDKTAHFIEYYFGQARSLALDSHDGLDKRFQKYVEVKQLQPIPELEPAIADRRSRISDFRDYQIAHLKCPRTSRATTWDAEGRNKMMLSKWNRSSGQMEYHETEELSELLAAIDSYIDLVLVFVNANRSRTNLKLATSGGQ